MPRRKLPHGCIFDLDGTLVDSLPDIAEAVNECLELLGLPPRPTESYRYMVGEGIPMLCQRVLGETHPILVPRLAELSRARYRVRPLRHTRPYPGVTELLQRLKQAGIKLAVLSNKPHDLTQRVVRAFWPDDTFACIQGYIEEEFRKPHPRYALEVCRSLGVRPARTWLIGDTPTDMETARRSGAVPVGAAWGFRTRADLEAAGAKLIFDHPDEIAPDAGTGPRPASVRAR